MKSIRELNNKNKLISEITCDSVSKQHASDLTLCVVTTGSGEFLLGSRRLTVYPGNFLMLNSGTSYTNRINADEPVDMFSLSFSGVFLNDYYRSWSSTDRNLLDDPFAATTEAEPTVPETINTLNVDLKTTIRHLKGHFANNSSDDMLMNEYFYHSLLLYNKDYMSDLKQKSQKLNFLNKQTREEIMKRLLLAKDYILSNYSKNICLEDISCNACLSVNHLLRTFRQAFNCSPHQFLVQTRLNRAKYLLKNSAYSVNEIVGMVGFECSSSFIRLFKSNYKVTPVTYRTS